MQGQRPIATATELIEPHFSDMCRSGFANSVTCFHGAAALDEACLIRPEIGPLTRNSFGCEVLHQIQQMLAVCTVRPEHRILIGMS